MKQSKLVMLMSLAVVVLTGCDFFEVEDSDSAFTVTAIDGYIVNGLVTTTCSNGDASAEFTGTTDESGRAYINPTSGGIVYTLDECTSKVEGVAGTYDADTPDESWEGNIMNSLPGLTIVNPYTDIANTISEVEGNESLSTEELKSKVLELFGYDDNYPYAEILFEDFGTSDTRDLSSNAEIALLAQAVFDVKTQLLAGSAETRAIGYYTFTAAQLFAFYDAVLTKVTGVVDRAIAEINEGDAGLYTIKVNIPESIMDKVYAAVMAIGEATSESELNDAIEALNDIASDLKPQAQIVIISVTETGTDATGTGTGTGTDGVNQG